MIDDTFTDGKNELKGRLIYSFSIRHMFFPGKNYETTAQVVFTPSGKHVRSDPRVAQNLINSQVPEVFLDFSFHEASNTSRD